MIDDRKNNSPYTSDSPFKKSPDRTGGERRDRRKVKGPRERGPGNRKKGPHHGAVKGQSVLRSAEARVEAVDSPAQILDGKFRGKLLLEPELNGRVPLDHPDREEIFRLFGRRVKASRFLDLCSGTGMVAIEALSRGAMLASLVERSAKRCSQIKKNLDSLGIKKGHAEIFESETAPFLKRMSQKRRFWDLVFYDPPFDAHYDDDLRFLRSGAALRPGGILAIRHHSEMFFPETMGVLRRRAVKELEGRSFSSYKRA